jgi:hypothetical protein
MLALLETLTDIIRLRKGPDAIPYSWLLCLLVLMLWVVAGFAITLTTPEMDDRDFLVATLTSVVGLACYASVIVLSDKTPRLLQTVTAIVGCGAILSLLSVVVDVVLSPFASDGATNVTVTLVLLWSVPVEGHIIARAIDRHWYVGILIAMAVFIFQLYLFALLNPDPAA